MTIRGGLIALCCLLLVGGSLSRLQLEADIFGLLPPDLPEIQALQLYNQRFGGNRELLLSLRASDAEAATAATAAIARLLQQQALASDIVWRNPLRDDPVARAELLGWLWFNKPPAEFEEFSQRFTEPQRSARLTQAMERIATAFDPTVIGRTLMDPLGLTELGSSGALSSLAEQDPFASADGTFRVLFLRAPATQAAGFGAAGDWIEAIKVELSLWQSAWPQPIDIGLGGTLAIDAEFGRGIIGDMQLAASSTLLLVALLFFCVHRRVRPLLWLSALLLFVLAATIAAGSWLFGALNVISLGFAAILLGLAAGYGLLLYQEAAARPDEPVAAVQQTIAPSIAWASATTAGAFLMVGRSSLPGMIQLGVMVALGIVIAAVVMVLAYLPPLAGQRPAAHRQGGLVVRALARRPRLVWWLSSTAVLLAGLAILAQPPALDPGTEPLGPRDSEARTAMREIEREIGGSKRSYWVITGGGDYPAVATALAAVDQQLQQAVQDGLLRQAALPTALWPRPDYQQGNQAVAGQLAQLRADVRQAMEQAGFADEALLLTDGALATYQRLASATPPALPQASGLRWLFRRFLSDNGEPLALGRLELAPGADPARLQALAAQLQPLHSQLASWQLASRSLLGTMQKDVAQVLLPMIAVLLVLLWLAFRRLSDVLLSVVTLGVSFLALLAVMGVAGWSWNLMNIMAMPLLLGVAVDYSIHVQLALQRHHGNVAQMHDTVGRAIMLAGATTAIGFGSLGLATNAGLASLGLVCATGVALACLISTLLLPVWWSALNRTPLTT